MSLLLSWGEKRTLERFLQIFQLLWGGTLIRVIGTKFVCLSAAPLCITGVPKNSSTTWPPADHWCDPNKQKQTDEKGLFVTGPPLAPCADQCKHERIHRSCGEHDAPWSIVQLDQFGGGSVIAWGGKIDAGTYLHALKHLLELHESRPNNESCITHC